MGYALYGPSGGREAPVHWRTASIKTSSSGIARVDLKDPSSRADGALDIEQTMCACIWGTREVLVVSLETLQYPRLAALRVIEVRGTSGEGELMLEQRSLLETYKH